jgi:hypothetical protein
LATFLAVFLADLRSSSWSVTGAAALATGKIVPSSFSAG